MKQDTTEPETDKHEVSCIVLEILDDKGKHALHPLHPDAEQYETWRGFVSSIAHEPGAKTDFAFIPVRVAWNGADEWIRRCAANVVGAGAFVMLDSDALEEHEARRLWTVIEARKLDAVAYSSPSHGLKAGWRFRLALRLDRDQTADEITPVRKGCAELFARAAGVPSDRVFDHRAMDRARVFFGPRCAPERMAAAFVWRCDGGECLSVDELVALVPAKLRYAEKRRAAGARKRAQLGLEGDEMVEATDAHRTAAAAEVEALASAIEACASGLRELTELRTFQLGRYVAAGILDEDSARARLRLAAERQRLVHGDLSCSSVEGRYVQIDNGLTDGWNEGPALPATTDAERDEIERAEDEAFGLAGGAAELERRLQDRVPARTHTLLEARELMIAALRDGLAGGKTLLHVSAGAGKTQCAAEVMAERAQHGLHTVFVTQEHAVLREVRAELERLGVDVVHLMSSLRAEAHDGAGRCELTGQARASALRAVELGFARHTVCKCAGCMTKPRRGAAVYLATYQDLPRALEMAGEHAALIVDEQPPLHQRLRLGLADLEWIRDSRAGGPWGDVERTQELVLRELVTAWLEGREPRMVTVGPVQVDPVAKARSWGGQLQASRTRAALRKEHAERLEVIRTAARIAAAVDGPEVTDGVDVMAPTPVGAALADASRPCIVLSATPVLGAFPEAEGWRHVRVAVEDAPGVSIARTVHYRGRVGRKALCPGRVANRDAVSRVARGVLADHPTGSLLLCTYKAVADALRGSLAPLLAGRDVVVCHFGAIRGKNEIEGRPVAGFDNYVSIGDPWSGGRDEVEADAGQAEGADAWREHAEAELGQFHARARDVRRTQPATHSHYGAELPAEWHAAQGVRVVVAQARVVAVETKADAREALHEAVHYLGRDEVARRLGVGAETVKTWGRAARTPPAERLAELQALVPTSLVERLGLHIGRRARLYGGRAAA